MKIGFVLVNSSDPDEMSHYAAFYLVLTVCQSTHSVFPGSVKGKILLQKSNSLFAEQKLLKRIKHV